MVDAYARRDDAESAHEADVDAVVDADSRYYTTTFLHLGILLFLLDDECMNTVNTDNTSDTSLWHAAT